MLVTVDTEHPDLGTLVAVIAHSQIVVATPAADSRRLPIGFDDVDIAVLEWIAAEGRRRRRRFAHV
jgi:hypothetical protein